MIIVPLKVVVHMDSDSSLDMDMRVLFGSYSVSEILVKHFSVQCASAGEIDAFIKWTAECNLLPADKFLTRNDIVSLLRKFVDRKEYWRKKFRPV